jgi:uncharacterized SAM-binding protein YcdF (DUF218 family)
LLTELVAADALRRNRRAWRSKGWRGVLAGLAVVTAFATGAWAGRDWLLRSAADLWIVSDPIGPADAVAVFGGGIEDRPFAAAQYYRQGLVTKILVSNDRQRPAKQLGVVMSDVAASKAVLIRLGTPASAIETFGSALENTCKEAFALRDWAKTHKLRSIIVPTEIFSTRRVRWMLHRALGSEFVVRVVALDSPEYRRDNWWHDTEGIIAFNNELIKYIYYRFKY